MSFLLYPILALAPSLIWLLFYLRKDIHPESKKMLLKVFFYGMAATIPAALIEVGLDVKLSELNLRPIVSSAIYFFVVVGLTEEICKYFAAKSGAFYSSELDEPLDLMLYMVVAALGFAAMENLLYLWPGRYEFAAQNSFVIALQRFVGATFLHALASGIFGYFLAMSFSKIKSEAIYMLTGLILASALHGLFNFSIIEMEGRWKFIIPLAILITLALGTSWGFQRLKKMQGVCKISS